MTRERGWHRGDFHVHSQRSHGGELTPSQLAASARAIGLDFLAVTEHNTSDTHAAWAALAGDDLLVILGQEVVTGTGHWLALGLPPGHDVAGQPARVHDSGGLCVVAHPHAPYPSGTFERPFEGFDAVEVWNGRWTSDLPWNADNEAALASWGRDLAADVHRGRWRPAIGNSDAHLAGQLGVPHTVVRAASLTSGAVLAAVRAGRCWVAESTAVGLTFTADAGPRRAGIGDRLTTGGAPVTARISFTGVPSATVTFHTDHGEVHRSAPPGSAEWTTVAKESAFIRAEIRHPTGEMAALTNPIVLT